MPWLTAFVHRSLFIASTRFIIIRDLLYIKRSLLSLFLSFSLSLFYENCAANLNNIRKCLRKKWTNECHFTDSWCISSVFSLMRPLMPWSNGLQRVLMGRFSTLRIYDDIATRLIARVPSTSNRDATTQASLQYAPADQREKGIATVYVEWIPEYQTWFSQVLEKSTATRRNHVSCVLTSQSAPYKMKRQSVERDKRSFACLFSIVDIIYIVICSYCKRLKK